MNSTLIRLIIVVLACIFTGCNKIISDDDDILADLESTLPESWYYSKLSEIEMEKVTVPVGLDAPVQISKIYNEYLAFWLFFYPRYKENKISSVIRSQTDYSLCVPLFFAESDEYYVVTSHCYLHSSSAWQIASEFESVTTQVKNYIEEK